MFIRGQIFPRLFLWILILGVTGVPVAWAGWVIVREPRVMIAGLWDARMMELFARTLLYALLSGIGAVALGVPVAMAMGRSARRIGRALWLIVPLPLLLPSMVTGYGWQEALSLLNVDPFPQSTADIARCIAILATWLWPIPAIVIAMSVQRIDQSLLEQSALDGVLFRMLARRMIAPAILSLALCVVLAMQEFAIFEPSGISVMATEIRMIFETGRLSSDDNPIAALVGGVGAADSSDLSGRAALSLAAGAPVLLLTGALAILATILIRKLRLDETIELTPPPARLRAGAAWTIGAWLIVLLTIGAPIAAMFLSLDRPLRPIAILDELAPQLTTSIVIAGCVGAIGSLIACLAALTPPRLTILIALISFLIGGQFTAIAMLRVFSTTDVGVRILDWNIPVVLAHAGRFAWIALLAGASLHAGAWRAYREMAGADGASPRQTLTHVILGMAWPLILLAGLLMGALSLVEVPATALLVPPSIIPMLLTWVHMQRYGPMLEASLILCFIVLLIGWSAIGLWAMMRGMNRSKAIGKEMSNVS